MAQQTNKQLVLTGSWQLFSDGLVLLREHLEKIIILLVLPLLVVELGALTMPKDLSLGLTIYLVGLLWVGLNSPALYLLTTRISLGIPITIGAAYRQGIKAFWRFAGYSFIVAWLTLGGYLLFIVPGLILTRRYLLGAYYLLDKNVSISEAMRASAELSKPVSGYIWGTFGVVLVITALSGFTTGLLASIPVLSAVTACLFSASLVFLVPLRYADVIRHVPMPSVPHGK